MTTSHWPEDMTPEAARLLLALSTIFELQEVEGSPTLQDVLAPVLQG